MSWLFSRALVEEFLGESSSAGELSAQWNSTSTPPQSLSTDKTTVAYLLSRYGMTCKPLTESLGEALLTWFLAGFHARISAYKANEPESRAPSLGCGGIWRGLLGRYDPVTHSLRTAQNSLIPDSEPSYVTLPQWGLMLRGAIYQRPHWERLTFDIEPGLLPTPRVSRGFTNPTLGKKRHDCLTTRLLGKPVLGMRPIPEFVEWMMNIPSGWTELNVSAMPNFRLWLQQHGACSEAP